MTAVLDVPVLDHPETATVTPNTPVLTAETLLPREPSAVAHGRAWLGIVLAEWGIDEDTAADAKLLLSELFGNAVRHAGGPDAGGKTLIAATRWGDRLKVSVSDPDPDTSAYHADASDTAESGRGLFLVHALSSRYGAYRLHDGKITFFEMDIAGGAA